MTFSRYSLLRCAIDLQLVGFEGTSSESLNTPIQILPTMQSETELQHHQQMQESFTQDEERQPSISMSHDDSTQSPLQMSSSSLSGKRKRDSVEGNGDDDLTSRRTSFKRNSPGTSLSVEALQRESASALENFQQQLAQHTEENNLQEHGLNLHDHTVNLNDHGGNLDEQVGDMNHDDLNMHEHATNMPMNDFDISQAQPGDLQFQDIESIMALQRAATAAQSRYSKNMTQAVHPTDPNLDPSFANLSPPEPSESINQAPPAPRLGRGGSAGANSNTTATPLSTPQKPTVGSDEWHRQRKDNHKEGKLHP